MNKAWFSFVNEHADAVWTEISISHSDSLLKDWVWSLSEKDADSLFVIVTICDNWKPTFSLSYFINYKIFKNNINIIIKK